MSLNGHIRVAIYSPNSTLGTDGYPVLTLTLDAPPLPVGTQLTAPLQGITITGPGGPLVLDVSHPVTITIGGSLSVSGVFPGGGTWPAGTVLSLRGSGFQPRTTVNAHLQSTPAVYVSSNELRLTLTHDQTIDRTLFEVANPDGSQQKFYSYLRGTLIQPPSQALLQASEPIFSTVTHATAGVTVPPLLDSKFVAIAVQNPNPGPVSVSVSIPATGDTASVYLPSQGRLVEDLSVLLRRRLNTGEQVSISATSPIQMVGIFGDQAAVIVSPILLSF
jgi:hypothetical protein